MIMDWNNSEAGRTVVLNDSGDTILLIGTGNLKQPVLVSKTAMILASPVWKAMLDRQIWSESTATEIPFPDDDVEAMLIILRIAHLRFRDLPPRNGLTLDGLFNLAVLCDKYNIAGVVKPFIDLHCWAEGFVPKTKDREEKNCDLAWFFIAWTFGYKDSFEVLAKYVLPRVHLDGDGAPLLDGELDFPEHMPPDFLESMLRIREDTINAMLIACYDIMDNVVTGPVCKLNLPMENDCRTMILGSYASFLIQHGFYPKKLTAQDYFSSISWLARTLCQVNVHAYESHNFRAIANEIVAKHTEEDTRVFVLPSGVKMNRKGPVVDSINTNMGRVPLTTLPSLDEFRAAGGLVRHTPCAQIVNLRSRIESLLDQIPTPTLDSH